MPGALLMAAEHMAKSIAIVRQRIVKWCNCPAGNPEDNLDAHSNKRFAHDLCAGSLFGHMSLTLNQFFIFAGCMLPWDISRRLASDAQAMLSNVEYPAACPSGRSAASECDMAIE